MMKGIARRKPRLPKLLGDTRIVAHDEEVASYTFTGLYVPKPALKYRLKVFTQVPAAGWKLVGTPSAEITVLPATLIIPDDAIIVPAIIDIGGKVVKEAKFTKTVFDLVRKKVPGVFWSNPTTDLGARTITIDAKGSQAQIDATLKSLCQLLKAKPIRFKIRGRKITLKVSSDLDAYCLL